MARQIAFESVYGIPPTKGTPGSAGYDLTYCRDEDIILKPGDQALIPLDLKVELPEDTVMILETRSSFAKQQIHVFGGVIDSDYRGSIGVFLQNSSTKPFTVSKNMKVCQGIIHITPKFEFKRVEKLENNTIRGEGSFGSTGSHIKDL